jgi:hypothetical protein
MDFWNGATADKSAQDRNSKDLTPNSVTYDVTLGTLRHFQFFWISLRLSFFRRHIVRVGEEHIPENAKAIVE